MLMPWYSRYLMMISAPLSFIKDLLSRFADNKKPLPAFTGRGSIVPCICPTAVQAGGYGKRRRAQLPKQMLFDVLTYLYP
jgi:hypothetical protein